MSSRTASHGPVKAPTGSYPKLWRLLDHYFLKEDVPDRTALLALDTIVALNGAILTSPKSANNRAIRSSEPQIRNLVEMGGTDILTEVGWRFKVMRMEECWVFPYDADLDELKVQQEKIIETQQKLKTRLTSAAMAVESRLKKEKADKLAIMKQIEADKLEREHRNAIRSGAPPRPTQSLDEVRKQANKERMERERARKAKAAAEAEAASQAAMATPLPGTFPRTTTSVASFARTTGDSADVDPRLHVDATSRDQTEEDSDIDVRRSHGSSLAGAPTGGRTPRQRPVSHRSRRSAPKPIQVKKPVVKETYMATENKLGGTPSTVHEQQYGADEDDLKDVHDDDLFDDQQESDEEDHDDDDDEPDDDMLGTDLNRPS